MTVQGNIAQRFLEGSRMPPRRESLGLEGEVGALREVVEDLRADLCRLDKRIVGSNGEGLIVRTAKIEQWIGSCRWFGRAMLSGMLILAADAINRWYNGG